MSLSFRTCACAVDQRLQHILNELRRPVALHQHLRAFLVDGDMQTFLLCSEVGVSAIGKLEAFVPERDPDPIHIC